MRVFIKWTYRTIKGKQAQFYSDDMSAEDAVFIVKDMEKTGRVQEIHFYDKQDRRWTLKELEKYIKGIETEPHHITVYFDGGFDLKTKKSGLGCAIYYDQNQKSYRLRKNALVDELVSNNEAEYAALYLGIQELELMGVHHMPVTFRGDSLVVINQLNGEWPCYEAELNAWADRIEQKLDQLGIIPEYEPISRKDNRETDQLATQALKNIEIESLAQQ